MHGLGSTHAGPTLVVSIGVPPVGNGVCCLTRRPSGHLAKAQPQRRLACRASSSSDGGSHDEAAPSSPVPDTLPLVAPDTDWRAFRAQLVATAAGDAAAGRDEVWAHAIPAPERGCLLLASPLMFLDSQTYFSQAVILILSHDAGGSVGVIINKPTEHRVRDLPTCDLQPHFGRCTVYLAGDVGPPIAQVLHPLPPSACPDAQEVLPGVSFGGFDGVRQALIDGRISPDQIKVLAKYSGWGPGQLESEVKRGVWYPAAASSHLVLQPAVSGAGPELWHAAMQLLGGEHAALSEAVRESFRADVMGQGAAGAGQAGQGGGEGGAEAPGSGAGGQGRDPDAWKGSDI